MGLMQEPAKFSAADFIREPAPGVAGHDVQPVNRKTDRRLYAGRQKVYPKLAHGRFRRIKWAVMAVTLGIYYTLPWIRWERGAGLPDQAFLMDPERGRLFFFFLEIWPQELYYITGLLVVSALGLFLFTSIAGRVWCGYACPQTVWTDLMITVERLWQGDRNARIRLDKEAWGPAKIFKKTMTHLSWLAIAVLTGGAFVFYFRDAPTLAHEFLTGTAPAVACVWLAIFTTTTYLLGGIAREQVCTYMCPWPRIQGAMTDRHTLLITYREARGEPRGPIRKSEVATPRGDCIDCKACVAVCPMGIDIRDGAQLECIQCALCIDACDGIMDRIDRPRGLIAYDTVARSEASALGWRRGLRLLRARTVLYLMLMVLVSGLMLTALTTRSALEASVLHDRGMLFVKLSDGGLRNGYTLKILNKLQDTREYTLAIEGLGDAKLEILARDPGASRIRVPADNVEELRVFVTVPASSLGGLSAPATPFSLVVTDTVSGASARRSTVFQSPSAAPGS
jgi:cytochrome c oxidase accessory protein FixG